MTQKWSSIKTPGTVSSAKEKGKKRLKRLKVAMI
jgi:hypothetical protein